MTIRLFKSMAGPPGLDHPSLSIIFVRALNSAKRVWSGLKTKSPRLCFSAVQVMVDRKTQRPQYYSYRGLMFYAGPPGLEPGKSLLESDSLPISLWTPLELLFYNRARIFILQFCHKNPLPNSREPLTLARQHHESAKLTSLLLCEVDAFCPTCNTFWALFYAQLVCGFFLSSSLYACIRYRPVLLVYLVTYLVFCMLSSTRYYKARLEDVKLSTHL